ncbi:hypothetical protein [Aphanothece stagnina]|uniref:hypothetical protein n=1 Tax=Aphanothece stagnina TaxID=1004305 RepID=UPI00398EF3F9
MVASGLQEMWYGVPQQTLLEQGTQAGLEAVGVSPEYAAPASTIVSTVVTTASGAGVASTLTRLGTAGVTTSAVAPATKGLAGITSSSRIPATLLHSVTKQSTTLATLSKYRTVQVVFMRKSRDTTLQWITLQVV